MRGCRVVHRQVGWARVGARVLGARGGGCEGEGEGGLVGSLTHFLTLFLPVWNPFTYKRQHKPNLEEPR